MTFLFYGLGAYLARYLHPDLLNTIRKRDKRKPSTSLYRSHEIGLQVKLTVSYSRGEFLMINRITQSLLRRLAYSVPGGYRLRPFLHRLRGVKIGKNVWISQYVYIDEIHPEAISIGDNTTIGIRTSIVADFYWGPRKRFIKVVSAIMFLLGLTALFFLRLRSEMVRLYRPAQPFPAVFLRQLSGGHQKPDLWDGLLSPLRIILPQAILSRGYVRCERDLPYAGPLILQKVTLRKKTFWFSDCKDWVPALQERR